MGGGREGGTWKGFIQAVRSTLDWEVGKEGKEREEKERSGSWQDGWGVVEDG